MCEHYDRNCKIISPCCNEIFNCRFCHDKVKDENEIDFEKAHKIDRFKIEKIICSKCNTKQNISNECVKCGIIFGKYFCNICNLWDNTDKKQFHCKECGLCRTGGKDNYYHCSKCNICISNTIKDNHVCNYNYKNICAFCQESTFDSLHKIILVKCGHLFHSNCIQKNLEHNNYNCPLCSKAIIDMSLRDKFLDEEKEFYQMPEEYKNKMVNILCNECGEKSMVLFHVVGHKCNKCGVYNTKIIK